ncbi:MAG: tetratricopeptide repeat protein [Gammaproteobacteria bacterium]|nr:tetratricopeptide repeat protein [Gammaproteobacteria bacterium]
MIENLEKMLADGRDDAMLRFGLGNAYFQNKDYDTAAGHLARALEHDPGYSAAWKLLGRARMQTGDLDAASRTFQDGINRAEEKGDKQAIREMQVFLKKIDKQRSEAS